MLRALTAFGHDGRGAFLPLVALAIVPLVLSVGLAIDYTSAAESRTGLQGAVDSVALSLAPEAAGLSDEQLEARGRALLNAQLGPRTSATVRNFKVKRTGKTIRVDAGMPVKTHFTALAGRSALDVAVSSTTAYGVVDIELALVLDNSHSMGQHGKLDKLKAASNKLLDKLQTTVSNGGLVKVSIVPFSSHVNLGVEWAERDTVDFSQFKKGEDEKKKKRDWQGCITDRDSSRDLDVKDESPRSGDKATHLLASECPYGPMQPIMPLTSNFGQLRDTIGKLGLAGNTNITIGTIWGLATLSDGQEPFTESDFPARPTIQRHMLVLTDGWNTVNRDYPYGAPSSAPIDARTRKACGAAQAAGIQMFVIRLVEGNESLLRECAGPNGTYRSVSDPAQLEEEFQRFANKITAPRITN